MKHSRTSYIFALVIPALLQTLVLTSQPKDAVVETTITTGTGSSFTVEKSDGIDPRYYPLIRRLVADGWEDSVVRRYFGDNRTVFIPKATLLKIPSTAAADKSAYAWVDTDESADACKAFIAKYSKTLERAEKAYGVDRVSIAALIRCETRHGTITGAYHLFSTFASMSLQADSTYFDSSARRARTDLIAQNADSTTIEKRLTELRARAVKRSTWAYKELGNVFRMAQRGTVDVMSINGSWAGAFGWCQFLPSSFLKLAVDGNGDRKIDLFNPSDAIFSVAHYLSDAGFVTGNDDKIRRALHNYNNSSEYVNSIVALSERVRQADVEK